MPPGIDLKILQHRTPLAIFILVTVTLLVYWQVTGNEFINLDDPFYLYGNKHVQSGLTGESFAGAFSPATHFYWHPLTWLSLMISVELFALDSGGHHLVNLLFHILNAILLFIVLKRMTGAFWQSLFVAAVFALHPINVESVAWLSERKNVLSTFFWMLTMLFYARYAEKPSMTGYALVFVSMGLGLMAKPMLITLPFVFLLLDFWPLNRWRASRQSGSPDRFPASTSIRLVLEKIPLLLLSILSIFASMTFVDWDLTVKYQDVPLTLRVANAIVSYTKYIGNLLWPRDLAVFYPFPEHIPVWQTGLAVLLLIGISIAALAMSRTRPYLIVGWLWFLGTLVPVIGIVQAGLWPAIADRFAYVPFIGLLIIVAWGIPDAFKPVAYRRGAIILSAAATIVLLSIQTWIQVGYWKNNEILYTHTIRVTGAHSVIYNNLGLHQEHGGHLSDAVKNYQIAIDLDPEWDKPHINLGIIYLDMGEMDKSIAHFKRAVEISPAHSETHLYLAKALSKSGKLIDAETHYRRVLELEENSPEAMIGLGKVMEKKEQFDTAMDYYRSVLAHQPDHAQGNEHVGNALLAQGLPDQAIPYLRKAVALSPENVKAQVALSSALLKTGGATEAVSVLEMSVRQNPGNGEVLLNLGNALIMAGDMRRAAPYLEKGLAYFPGDYDTREKVLRIRASLDEAERALRALNQNIQKDPDNPVMHIKIARIHHSIGELEEAKSHYRKALSIDPNAVPALEGLSAIHASEKNFASALENLIKINKLDPYRADIPYNIACMYARQERIDDSLQWLNIAVQKGYNRWDQIKSDPDLDNIRGTEGYRQLVQSN